MIAALVVLCAVLIAAAVVVWDRVEKGRQDRRARGPTPPMPSTPRIATQRRFQRAPTSTPPAPAVPRVARRGRIGHSAAPQRAERIRGRAHLPDGAIGRACGRPMADCVRGDDCLCRD